MSGFHNNALIGASGQGGYQINQSLRFNSADSAYLVNSSTRTVAVGAYTFSFWIKRCALSSQQRIWSSQDASGASNKWSTAIFGADDKLYFYHYSSADIDAAQSNGVLRDTAAWYHIVFSKPASAVGTLYINGVAQTKQTSYTADADVFANAKYIGRNYDGTGYSNCYLTEFYGIDGQALTPSSFGETDTITGAWIPKRYSGSYGTNGFYLNFSDNSGTTSTTLGKDSSGNGNNWTPNNFSVTAGAGNDSLTDTPTPYADGGNGRGNYCTWNPLKTGTNLAPEDGNLFARMQSNGSGINQSATATMYVSSGKWYWEGTSYNTLSGYGQIFGIASDSFAAVNSLAGSTNQTYGYEKDGPKYNGFTGSSYGASYTSNDVIGVALDLDAGTLVFYKNGVSQGTAFTGLSGTFTPYCGLAYNGGGPGFYTNFGQRAFAYTPPTGFKALNTANLPEPTIKKGSKYFDTVLYTGNGGTQAISGLSFSPDLVWIKARSVGYNHQLQDTVRGAGKELQSDLTGAETSYGLVSAFNSDGFTVFTNGTYLASNQNGTTYAAWCWDANGAGSSNTAGTITSTVSANASAGFSIVTYTGTLSSTPGTAPTVGHGLGVAPSLIISKSRNPNGDDSGAWYVNHVYDHTRYLRLNSTASAVTIASQNGGTAVAPTSTVFSTYYIVGSNTASNNYVAYCFSEVAGYSKFGSYTGNGSTDGPFLFCGFQPKFLLIKSSSSGYDWFIFDDARNTYNVVDLALFPNVSGAESGPNVYSFDFLSNGFKLRNTQLNLNGSGNTYIFAAFAELPFKYANAR